MRWSKLLLVVLFAAFAFGGTTVDCNCDDDDDDDDEIRINSLLDRSDRIERPALAAILPLEVRPDKLALTR
jgi:hypothetical protein